MAINVEKFADEVAAKIGAEEAQLVRDLQFKLDEVTKKHDVACFTITDLQKEREHLREQLDNYSDVLRELASYVGCGGYNSYGRIAPKVAEEKIRWGIDHLLRVETGRREAAECRLSKFQKQLDDWEQAVKAGTPLGILEGITELRFTLNGGEPSAVERPEPLCGIKGCDLPRNHDGWCNLGPLSE